MVQKTGVISDSRPGPLLINDDAIVPQGTQVEVIFLHLQHEASKRYYEKLVLREAHERIYNYVRHNSHIYTSEILVVSTGDALSSTLW